MIGFLSGELLEINGDTLLVLVGGVGYEVLVPSGLVADLWVKRSSAKEVRLWVHTHVREDQLQLFGFANLDEKLFFLNLLKVNGIGPKLALGVLSAAPTSVILDLIERGDAKALAKLPRLGKKTAEQMILSLRGKLVFSGEASPGLHGVHKEISFALCNLGFRENVVSEFVSQLPEAITVEEGVREGLMKLSQNRGG